MPIRGEQHLLRDVAGAEAGNLDPVGEVVRRVLDRVLHLARRDLDRQADAVAVELLELGLHRRAIESERVGLPLAVAARGARLQRRWTSTHAIRTRRTHKAFEPEPVDRETIEALFELARFAPNHHLTEPWRFRVIGPETFDRLVAAGAPNEASKLGRAPTLVVASARLTGDDYQNREDVLATACATYIVLLAAHARGLASYWRTPALFETPEGASRVGLADDEEFVALIHLGRPATSPPAKERKPVAEYVEFLP